MGTTKLVCPKSLYLCRKQPVSTPVTNGSGVMTIFVCKGLTRNPEIPPSEFCPKYGGWNELGIPDLANVFNKKLINAAKCQGYSFYRFWVIKGNPPHDSVTLLSDCREVKSNAPEGKLSRFLKNGMGLLLGHSLIIKWTWGFFPKICNLNPFYN